MKYETYNTVYINKIRSKAKAIHDAADEHNLRLDPDNPNHDPALSHNNKYYILDQSTNGLKSLTTPTKEHLQELRAWQQQKHESFKKTLPLQSSKNKNNSVIQNSKRALNKFLQNEKTTDEEKDFFTGLLRDLEDKKQITESHLNDFLQITEDKKTARYNDKLKRIKTMMTVQHNIEDRRALNATQQTEYMFKVPDDNNIKLSNEELLNVVKKIKTYFPDHNILYVAIHHDENPENPHIHFAFSNINNKTNQYDFVDQEVKAVKKWFEKKGEAPEFLSKTKHDMTIDEVSLFGQVWQDFMYEIMTEATAQKYNFQKRDVEQIEQDNHIYQSKKPMINREFNRNNKLKSDNEKLGKTKVLTIKSIEEQENKLLSIKNDTKKKKKLNKKITGLNEKNKKHLSDILATKKEQNQEIKQQKQRLKGLEEQQEKMLEKTKEIIAAQAATFAKSVIKPFRPRKWFEMPFLYKKKKENHIRKILEERRLKIEQYYEGNLTQEQNAIFDVDSHLKDALKQSEKPVQQQKREFEDHFKAIHMNDNPEEKTHKRNSKQILKLAEADPKKIDKPKPKRLKR